MLLDKLAWRPAASAAAERHCPAMDCSVAMSTFTVPPRSGSFPGAADGRGARPPAAGRRPQPAPSSTDPAPPLPRWRHPRHPPPVTSTPAGDGPAARGTRCWSLHGAEGVVDVEVDAPDDGELGTVLGALGELLGTAAPELWAGSTRLPVDLPLTAGDLQHGALLGLGRPGPRPTVEGSSALELQVTGGPEAGRTIGLGTGSHLLGRGSAADIRLDDPDVSRRHAVVAVGGDGISVTDLGSINGTRLGDRDVGAQPRPWPVGDVLRLGSTSVRVTGPAAVPAALGGSAAGRAVLHPASRLPPHHAEVEVAVPGQPEQPQPRRLQWQAVGLPAVAGVVMGV